MKVDISQLEELCTDLLILKEHEKEITDLRIARENQIAELVATKDEGTDKAQAGVYKITVTSKLTRTLDYPAYCAIEADIPQDIRPVILKPTLDLKNLRLFEQMFPDLPPHFITTKTAKATVKIEEIA